MALLITLAAFITSTLAVLTVYRLATRERELVEARIERFLAPALEARGPVGRPQAAFDREYSRAHAFRRLLHSIGDLLKAKSIARRIEVELEKANVPMRGSEFIGLMAVTAVIGSFVGFWLGGTAVSLAGFGAGLAAPRAYLKYKAAARIKAFNGQIVDALTMTSGSLKAGYSFLQAMEMVSSEMPDPIAHEFRRSLKDMNLGMPTEEALTAMGERIGSDDLDLVITAVLIQRQVGGNLAEVLDNISNTVRERIRIKGEIKTLTAQGRISGMVIALLPVGIGGYITLVNPNYIGPLFGTAAGKMMIGASIVGEIIGVMVIKKIVSIEV